MICAASILTEIKVPRKHVLIIESAGNEKTFNKATVTREVSERIMVEITVK